MRMQFQLLASASNYGIFPVEYHNPNIVGEVMTQQTMCDYTLLDSGVLNSMLTRRPDLDVCKASLVAAATHLCACFDRGNSLFTCGNGGSYADSLHIVGELCKSFERKRPLDPQIQDQLFSLPYGEELIRHLEAGFSAITLGANGALKTAIENDCPLPNIAFAQELNALMRTGDVLLAISTSGNARNCVMAMSVAKAKHGKTIALTGPTGGQMATIADIVITAPGNSTKEIQEAHAVLWHTLCLLVEARFFPDLR